MSDKDRKRFPAGEGLESIFEGEDSQVEQFDSGSDIEMVPDTRRNSNDSDEDTQIIQIISNLDLDDSKNQDVSLHDTTTQFEVKPSLSGDRLRITKASTGRLRF